MATVKEIELRMKRKREGQRFLDAFGVQGGVWFAQGRTWHEAVRLHRRRLAEARRATAATRAQGART